MKLYTKKTHERCNLKQLKDRAKHRHQDRGVFLQPSARLEVTELKEIG